MRKIALALFLLCSTAAFAQDTLAEILASVPVAAHPTSQPVRNVELCVGLVLADGLLPTVLDGPDRLLVIGWENSRPSVVATLTEIAIEVRGRRGIVAAKYLQGIQSCAQGTG